MGNEQGPPRLAKADSPDGASVASPHTPWEMPSPAIRRAVYDWPMMKVEELRWYYAHVDFGPGIQPWVTAIEAASVQDARAQLERDFAAEGVAATVGEVGLISDLPAPNDDDDDDDVSP